MSVCCKRPTEEEDRIQSLYTVQYSSSILNLAADQSKITFTCSIRHFLCNRQFRFAFDFGLPEITFVMNFHIECQIIEKIWFGYVLKCSDMTFYFMNAPCLTHEYDVNSSSYLSFTLASFSKCRLMSSTTFDAVLPSMTFPIWISKGEIV